MAYETMCRREELVSLQVEDIAQATDGSGRKGEFSVQRV